MTEDDGYAALARDPEAIEHWQATRRARLDRILDEELPRYKKALDRLGGHEMDESETTEDEIDAMMAAGEPVELAGTPVTITYDPAAGGAAYIYLGPGPYNSVRTQELDDNVMVDCDADGNVIGVELIGVAAPVIVTE